MLKVTRSRQRIGFTLVELLAVIGIIALLIAILLPVLSKARESAQAAVCQSNMRQIGMGLEMYCDSNKGQMPLPGEDGDPNAPLLLPDHRGWRSESLWINAVSRATFGKSYAEIQEQSSGGGDARIPQAGDHHVLVCPSAPPAVGVTSGTDADEVTTDGYFLMHGFVNTNGALAQEPRKTFICYALNNKLFGGDSIPGKLSQLRPSSEIVVVIEKRTSAGEASAQADAYYASAGGKAGSITASFLGRFKGDWRRLSTRHYNGGYVLFADGHVSLFTLRDVLTPRMAGLLDWNKPGLMIWNVTGPAH